VKSLARFVRAKLHRRLFVWFGVSILAAGFAAAAAMFLAGPRSSAWRQMFSGAQSFAGAELGAVWDRPVERDALLA
jgi:two-component system, OmpR family, sensor kinase